MEFVVLGLLMMQSQTVYELNQSFKRGISLFYSASYGSLQAALKKLLEKGWVAYSEEVENGRHKKVYAALPAGQEAFLEWMRSETPDSKLEVTALSKMFFLGLVEGYEEKRAILKEITEKLDSALSGLEALDRELEHMDVPEPYRDIFRYQRKTLEYGIGSHRFAREWFARELEALERLPEA
ncbi:PadR family transcriptional regulator [Paenibacillus soyae]|uniref:PadR family transcriptional regulator n=1 Tax=Paenibacillus soyae TaxID=2969249 RepID=A0A9X2MVG1_9BACL|nr:PadR family transcriptional regulator [Paenibacillus soyae]MCR2806596.1 PadR family transcriptional regulator [Paenibacillus soyae]